jgi:serine O-acetyltransferase
LLNRALWALVVYRFGRCSMQQTFPPWRWLTSKIHGVLKIFSEIVTGVIMDRTVRVGKGFHIIHPERVWIHAEAVIGDNVAIMHGMPLFNLLSSSTAYIAESSTSTCSRG